MKDVVTMYFFASKYKSQKERVIKGRLIGVMSLVLLLVGTALLQMASVSVNVSAKGQDILPMEKELLFVEEGAELPVKQPDSLYATSAVLMDADTGRVLFEKNGTSFMANASTTKILTCIVALEQASLDEVVTVSSYAASMPKVKLYIKAGEHYKLKDLLYSLMLESHNDSAVAIAEHVGGSMEGFADMMNAKAKELGCVNSYFITPNGLDATENVTDASGNVQSFEHGTTAAELARIMAYCAFESPQKENFLAITRTQSYSFSNEEGRSFSCINHNAFLTMLEGALTGKTGFTNKAGYCYVGALERDGKRFTIALLACGWPNHKTWKWADAKTLFTYGLENYVYKNVDDIVPDKRVFQPILVNGGQTGKLDGQAYTNVKIIKGDGKSELLLRKDEEIDIYWETKETLNAPVMKGQQVGFISYIVGEEVIREDKIVIEDNVYKIDFFWCLRRVLEKYAL